MTQRSDGTKTGRRVFACRVAVESPAALDKIAFDLKCYRVCPHTGELVGAVGVLMDKIASGEFVVVQWQALPGATWHPLAHQPRSNHD